MFFFLFSGYLAFVKKDFWPYKIYITSGLYPLCVYRFLLIVIYSFLGNIIICNYFSQELVYIILRYFNRDYDKPSSFLKKFYRKRNSLILLSHIGLCLLNILYLWIRINYEENWKFIMKRVSTEVGKDVLESKPKFVIFVRVFYDSKYNFRHIT